MKYRNSILFALVAALLVVVAGAGCAVLFAWYLLPEQGCTARGVRIGGAAVAEGQTPAQHVRALGERLAPADVRRITGLG
ncbi:MAG: hypothetical protein ACOC1F_11850, partial [Myxococcota bacterium]